MEFQSGRRYLVLSPEPETPGEPSIEVPVATTVGAQIRNGLRSHANTIEQAVVKAIEDDTEKYAH